MASKKQTAVEWLAAVVSEMRYVSTDVLNQALEMEKQQLVDAWDDGAYGGGQFTTTHDNSEQYYKETYEG